MEVRHLTLFFPHQFGDLCLDGVRPNLVPQTVIDETLFNPQPQAEFDYGSVLSRLIAARLADPIALVNVANWAAESGAEFLWGIPAEKLNDLVLGLGFPCGEGASTISCRRFSFSII